MDNYVKKMLHVAPKLLAVKSEKDLERICCEHKIHYRCYFRRSKREYVNTPEGSWRLPFELLPSDILIFEDYEFSGDAFAGVQNNLMPVNREMRTHMIFITTCLFVLKSLTVNQIQYII